MSPFTVVAASVFSVFGLIWSRKNWPDLLIKILLFGMGVWGFVTFFKG